MANRKSSGTKKAKYMTKQERSVLRKQNLANKKARESEESSEPTVFVTAFRCVKCPHRPIILSEGLNAHRDFHKIKKTLHATKYTVSATLPLTHPMIPRINKRLLRKRTDYKGDAYYEVMGPLVLSRKVEEDPVVKDMFAGALQRQKKRSTAIPTASTAVALETCASTATGRKSPPRLQKQRKTQQK